MRKSKQQLFGPLGKVPYFSQIDDITESDWQQTSCGLVALYMVMRYWSIESDRPLTTLDDMLSRLEVKAGFKPGIGWVHSQLAGIARRYGFNVVVRSWFMREPDLKIMHTQERIVSDREELDYTQAVAGEMLSTLLDHLRRGIPIIMSVKPHFLTNNSHNHLVVLVGYGAKNGNLESIIVHDPYAKASAGGLLETTPERLVEYCNFNAIIIQR